MQRPTPGKFKQQLAAIKTTKYNSKLKKHYRFGTFDDLLRLFFKILIVAQTPKQTSEITFLSRVASCYCIFQSEKINKQVFNPVFQDDIEMLLSKRAQHLWIKNDNLAQLNTSTQPHWAFGCIGTDRYPS